MIRELVVHRIVLSLYLIELMGHRLRIFQEELLRLLARAAGPECRCHLFHLRGSQAKCHLEFTNAAVSIRLTPWLVVYCAAGRTL